MVSAYNDSVYQLKGAVMETVRSRVLQDNRKQSRISVQMECRFKTSDDKEYGALMLDLSQGGAFISSTLLNTDENLAPDDSNIQWKNSRQKEILPSAESKISIILDGENVRTPLTLKGTIKRSIIGMSEYGKVAQFGVEFENTPLELLRLISMLSSRRKMPRISAKTGCRFRLDDKEYEATLKDISNEGALLASVFLPDLKSKIFVTFETTDQKAPLTFEGTVTRCALSKLGEGGQFGVEFENAIPEQLISALTTRK